MTVRKRTARRLIRCEHCGHVLSHEVDGAVKLRIPSRLIAFKSLDGADAAENTRRAVQFCLENPRWRLSLQTHKALGIP